MSFKTTDGLYEYVFMYNGKEKLDDDHYWGFINQFWQMAYYSKTFRLFFM